MAKNCGNYRRRRERTDGGNFGASRLGAAVTVLEKNDKPGRKLLATGNGRCNFTNRYQDASCYRTGNQERASRVLKQFTEQDTEQFFEQLGIRIRRP